MRKVIGIFSVFVALVVLPNFSNLYGSAAAIDSQVVIADANDVAVASSPGGDVNFTLMGFSSVPLVLDVSAPLSPQILSDVQPLGESVPFGAYLGLQGPAELYAAGAEAITEITSLQAL